MMKRIDSISTILPDRPDDLLITATSFEERCLGAAEKLRNYSTRCAAVVNFSSRIIQADGERVRDNNSARLYALMETVDIGAGPRGLLVPPYRPDILVSELLAELHSREIDLTHALVSFDMTCFTKIHLVCLLAALLGRIEHGTIRLLYTLPSEYKARPSQGYMGPLTVPLTRPCDGLADPYRRIAVVSLGHEGDRVLKAWRHVEPHQSVLVRALSNDKKLSRLTDRNNEYLIGRIGTDGSFSNLDVDRLDFSGAFDRISECLAEKDPHVWKVSIVPFGPKPIIAALTAWSVTRQGTLAIDMIYSVPRGYNVWYSKGSEGTYTIELNQSVRGA